VITLRRTLVVTAALFGGFCLVAAVALTLGSAAIGLGEIARVLRRPWQEWGDLAATVILGLRLPRILLAAMAGAGLAVAGAAFQGLTRNPLADPAILGVASGAAFGVVVAQVLGLEALPFGFVPLAAFAFGGALLAATAVYLIASVGGRLPIQTLLLAGVITGLFFTSAITLIVSLLDFGRLGGVIHWLLGNLSSVGYRGLEVMAIALAIGVGLVYAQARSLNLLALGEESALQLGVEAERVKRIIFLAASLLTGVVVAFTGPIGFVGLIVPHAVRMLFGPDHRLLIPAAVLSGAGFLVLADGLARTLIRPAELPVGVITAFCGAPFFIYLLRTRLHPRL